MKAVVAGMLGVGLCLLVGVGCPDKSKEQQPVAIAPTQPPPVQSYPEPQVQQPEPQPAVAAEPAPEPEPVDKAATSHEKTAPKAKAHTQRQAPKESYARERKTGRTYVVKKGDTLQKISSKFYGTTKNWQKIYQANKKTIKDPDSLVEGTRLAIP